MKIYCVKCDSDVIARKTDGKEIYPHRQDLHYKIFWKCDGCGGYVGSHTGDNNNGQPLGVIPTEELRKARMSVHEIIDPIWKNGFATRKEVYKKLRDFLGYEYHSGETKTITECDEARIQAIKVKDILIKN